VGVGTPSAATTAPDGETSLPAKGRHHQLAGSAARLGVDALVGHQTRAHRDLDVDLDAHCEESTVTVLTEMAYTVETDWRPDRIELHAPGRGRVDLPPARR
jgi:aminoglycoside-2''-adenylyltransferase